MPNSGSTIKMLPQKLRHIRPGNISLIVFCLVLELVQTVAPVLVLLQTRRTSDVFISCCSPSVDMLCVQRCTSAYFGCNKCLFELLLPSNHLPPVCHSPLTSAIRKVFTFRELLITGYSLFLDHSQQTLEIALWEYPIKLN